MKIRILIFTLFITNFLFSQNFHDTQGKLEISSSGQATYTLPIAMPLSLKDVGPIINLTYSSGQFGGIAGQGWGISSISAINRIATRIDVDGYVDGVDFDSNDMLALDGQRLILKSGTYWASGSSYQTEVQSNTRIELSGSGASTYFIVTAPDGSRSWYGNYGGMDATDLTAFYIVRFEDTDGNYITYHYSKPFNATLCISEIKFSANTNGLAPINNILFTYKQAKRNEFAYIKGVKHEKRALLDYVEVKTNNQLFRKYQLTHVADPQLGYEKITQIQEFNGSLEPANPINFEYENTSTQIEGSERRTTYYNNLNFDEIELSGDFDGDGKLDFATKDKMYIKLFENSQGGSVVNLTYPATNLESYSSPTRQRFTAQTMTQNKLNTYQSIVFAQEELHKINFKIYNLENNQFVNSYTKTIEIDNEIYCESECPYDECKPIIRKNNKYIEGDFNGDGVSEVLILGYDQMLNLNYESGTVGSNEPIIDIGENTPIGTVVYWCMRKLTVQRSTYRDIAIVDLNPNVSTSTIGSGFHYYNGSGLLSGYSDTSTKILVADFNGDGKSDVLFVKDDASYRIVTFKKDSNFVYGNIELIGSGTFPGYTRLKQLLIGDYNGDGKIDIMMPDTEGGQNHTLWHIYYSNPNPAGGSFFIKESHNIVEYWPNTGGYYDTQTHLRSYYAMDANSDGKSDLVMFREELYKPSWSLNDHNTQWEVTTFINNIGNTTVTGNKFVRDYNSPSVHDSDNNWLPVPIASTYRQNGLDKDMVIVQNQNNTATYIDFTKDVAKDYLLKKVTSSGGNIVDEITYKAMEPETNANNGLGVLSDFYSSGNSTDYPNVEIKKLTTNKLVSQLKNTVEGNIKYQDFRYHGLVINMHGLGLIGFNKTARSTWYQNPNLKKIWSVTENNPLWRGATKRNYTQLVENNSLFSFISNGDPTGIVNSTVNEFQYQTTNTIFNIYRTKETVKDYLTNVTTLTDFSYDPTYLLPISTTTSNFLNGVSQGTTTATTVFDNSASGAGSAYFIGRPTSTKTVKNIYNDTFESSEEYFYTNNHLTKTKKKGNTADAKYLVEEFEYGLYGNIKKKTISSEGYTTFIAPRATEYTYDTSGRFVKTIKDAEGMTVTNVSFHPLYGTILSTTDAYGLTASTEYDNWGKVKKVTDYLGKNIITTYSKSGNEYLVAKNGDDGSSGIQKSDALGRVKTTGVKNIDNTWSYKTIEYDYLGREYRKSEPYSSGSPSQWNTIIFDDYNRIKQNTTPTGLITNITYNGLTVTANDGIKTTSSTKNANGHVVNSTDPGGTIYYSYYANGNLKESDYEGTKIGMKYDEWGRKKELSDPSAGTYTYSYYSTGESFEETTPKGTTKTILNSVGKPIEKTVIGDLTNIKTIYTYDPTTKLLSSTRYDDYNEGDYAIYNYGYDQYKRLSFTDESRFLAYYQRATLFDAFGRPEKELYTAVLNNKRSDKWTRNTYKNGHHWQILDDGTSQVLWQTNSINARGQLTGASLGNGITISNTYDNYGFATQFKHDRTGANPANIMTLNTAFEPLRGNLTSRYNSMFGWNESFTFDNFDRLTSFTNGNGQQETQEYDDRGRITQNNLGTYAYSSSKAYQNTSIALNTTPTTYYANREGIFNDGMESQKGWTTYYYPAGTITFDNSKSHSGDYSIKLKSTSPTENMVFSEIYVPIDNAQATEYTYSAWVYSDGPEAEMFLYMKTAQETGTFSMFDGVRDSQTGTWKKITKTFLVPANIKFLSLRLDNNGGNGNVWYDDLQIKKTQNGDIATRKLNITYNTFKSPVQIEETGVDKISFIYNPSNERSSMFYGGLENDKMQRAYRKHYSMDGSMEIKHNTVTGEVEFLTYIGGDAYSAPIVMKSDGTTQQYLYLHRDYQGSILAITNQSANIVEKRLFDAWGNIVKVQDGQGNNLAGLTVLDRGYTGHEHLQSVGLIHMNGRLYDAKLHRFLQPDNFIQDPYNTQNYNRYGYVLNNPLKYTDPTGELFGLDDLAVAVIIGAIIASTTYTLTALLSDVPFTAGGFIRSAITGAISGAVTSGIGSAFTNVCQFGLKLTYSALAHGMAQGIMSGVQGGNFWVSFASGALSSIASSSWQGGGNWKGVGGTWGSGDFGTIAFGTVSGGAGAALTGGNFWQGAATGLTVSLLNHVAHRSENSDGDPPIKTKADKITTPIGPKTPIQDSNGNFNPDAYNCHSYAWSNSMGDPSDPSNAFLVSKGVNRWDNNPGNNTNGYHSISFDAPNQVGDRVIYYAWDNNAGRVVAQHSAVVTKINSKGQAVQVTSKLGQSYLATHHPRNAPSSYGSTLPKFTAPNGNVYPSRVYYRKN